MTASYLRAEVFHFLAGDLSIRKSVGNAIHFENAIRKGKLIDFIFGQHVVLPEGLELLFCLLPCRRYHLPLFLQGGGDGVKLVLG